MVVGMSWRAVSGTIWGCCGPRKPRKLRLRGERMETSKRYWYRLTIAAHRVQEHTFLMSAYTRQPKKTVVHCSHPGCKWLAIYFDDPRKMPHAVRAAHGISTHERRCPKRVA